MTLYLVPGSRHLVVSSQKRLIIMEPVGLLFRQLKYWFLPRCIRLGLAMTGPGRSLRVIACCENKEGKSAYEVF